MAGNAFASSVLKKDSDASVNLRIDPKAREVLFFKSLDGKESLIFKGAFEQPNDAGKYIVRREEGETCPVIVINVYDARGHVLDQAKGNAIATVSYEESEAMGTAQRSCHEDFLGNYTL